MNLLTESLIFWFLFSGIRSDFLGYNELNLIEERKPFKINCISEDKIPDHFVIKDIKWFNITSKSTDPYEHQNSAIPLDTNQFVSIRGNGELFSRSASPQLNGYYSCRVHYSYRRHHRKRTDHKRTDYRLHLIEVTKRPVLTKSEESLQTNDNQMECPNGYYLDSNRCRPCPSGTYRRMGGLNCFDCPINTYNPFFGQSFCIDCPEYSQTGGQGFEELGSTHVKQCKYFYSQGFFGHFS